ncbi:MAG: hypothetical protein WBD53_04105 [Xanthobacteraceae bacterium]
MIELHWTREQVLDQVDILFLEDLHRVWADAPPLRKAVAAYLGYKPRARASRDYSALLSMFPGGRIK